MSEVYARSSKRRRLFGSACANSSRVLFGISALAGDGRGQKVGVPAAMRKADGLRIDPAKAVRTSIGKGWSRKFIMVRSTE